MAFNFVPCDREQQFLMPPSVQEWLPVGHRARALIDVVEELDLSAFYARHRVDGRGGAAYDPKMMLTLLLYAYWSGERSSRSIERMCLENVACRVICANLSPDHTAISRFRQRHEQALGVLLVESVRVCAAAGLVDASRIAIDGRKLAGNASLDANRTLEGLEKEIQRWLEEAAAVDAREDELFGPDRRGDELPPQLNDPQQRRERIRRAKAELEAQRAEPEQRYEQLVEKREAYKREHGRYPRGRPPKKPEAAADAKVNLTDPDTRVLKGRRGFVQGYNTQVAATEKQIVIAAEIADEANDQNQLTPTLEAAKGTLAAAGVDEPIGQVLADAGYGTEQELLDAENDERAPEFFVAITSPRRSDPGKRARMPDPDSARGRMHQKLRTERGKQIYKKRGPTIEGVFGQQQTVQRFDRFSRRGRAAARSELRFVNAAHNIAKLIADRLRQTTPPRPAPTASPA